MVWLTLVSLELPFLGYAAWVRENAPGRSLTRLGGQR